MLLTLLFAVGVTTVITKGTLFRSLRSFYPELLSCALCLGTWVGFLFRIAYLAEHPQSALLGPGILGGLDVLGFGTLAGVLSLFVSLLLSFLDTLAALLDKLYEKH